MNTIPLATAPVTPATAEDQIAAYLEMYEAAHHGDPAPATSGEWIELAIAAQAAERRFKAVMAAATNRVPDEALAAALRQRFQAQLAAGKNMTDLNISLVAMLAGQIPSHYRNSAPATKKLAVAA